MRRIGLIALMCCSLLIPLGSGGGARAAALQADARSLDLPAILPNADDLAEYGLEGYTLTSTGSFSQASDAAFIASLLGIAEADVDALFTETGREGSYLGTMTLLVDPGDASSPLARELQTTVYAFADEEGAAVAYDMLTDEGNDPNAEDVDGGAFGDQSELTRRSGDSGTDGQPYDELELQFQSGRLLVFSSLYDYQDDAPDVEDMDGVGALLEGRAEAILNGDAPGLTALVPLFPEDPGAIPYIAYWARDGAGLPINRELPDQMDARVESYGEAVDFLSYQQQIVYGDDSYDDDFLFNNNLLRFESADDAVAFVEETEARITSGANHISLEVVDDAPAFGDASITVLRTSIFNGQEWTRYQVNVAVGEVVMIAWVAQVVPDIVVPAAPLYELAAAQTTCLEDGGCDGTIDVPAGITEEAAPPDDAGDNAGGGDGSDQPTIGIEGSDGAGATPAATEDGNPPAGDGDAYESPRYGYTLTYDQQAWEVSAGDPDPDDSYDRVSFSPTDGIDGVVTIIGDPDYRADEMSSCVSDYAAGLRQSDGVSDVAAIDGEDGDDDGRAWAAYSYVLAGDDGEDDLNAVRYIECASTGDVTIVVLQSSVDTDYEALSAARLELLSGLEP